MRACCKEDRHRLDVEKQYYYRDVFSRWVNLAYDKLILQENLMKFLIQYSLPYIH